MLFALFIGFAGTTLAADGAAIFKSKCLACHGSEGKGTAMAPAFQGNEFVKTSESDVIAQTIQNGREGDQKMYKQFVLAMPPQKGVLSADEISAVITYLKSLASK